MRINELGLPVASRVDFAFRRRSKKGLSIVLALAVLALASCAIPGIDNHKFLQSAPPMPPRPPKVSTIIPPPIQTTNSVYVRMRARFSTNLVDWIDAGSMQWTQAMVGNAFWTGDITVSTFSTNPPPLAVLTWHYDNNRSGVNASETALTPANVNTNTFGKLFSCQVDNWLYAQPLYVPGLNGHNAVFAASLSNTVYCFDADNGQTIWQTNLGTPVLVPAWTTDYPTLGILGTPVIDLNRGLLYCVAWKAPTEYDLHAINITNGADHFVSIPATTNNSFNPAQFNQRSALTLAGNTIVVPWTCTAADGAPSCVMSFDSDSLQQTAIWNSGGGGIWMAGCGAAFDGTNIYFATGNDNSTNVPPVAYCNSVIRLSATNLTLLDYFCPSNCAALSANDEDLGSGGVILMPGTNLLLACGKEGRAYLLDRGNLGGFSLDTNRVIEQWGIGLWANPSGLGHGVWSTPTYFNGLAFFYGYADLLKSFAWNGSSFNPTASAYSVKSFIQYPDSTTIVSANGTNSAICWYTESAVLYTDYGNIMVTNPPPAILHALNAYDLSQELWNSNMNTNDAPGQAVKYTVPIVANGKVYVGTQNAIAVYGLK